MHPFTLLTKTYLKCLLSESNKAFKKNTQKFQKGQIVRNQKVIKSNFSNLKHMYEFQKWTKLINIEKNVLLIIFSHWIYLNPMKLSHKVKNWFSIFLKYSNNFPFLEILDFLENFHRLNKKALVMSYFCHSKWTNMTNYNLCSK